jgi:hypothetical protein
MIDLRGCGVGKLPAAKRGGRQYNNYVIADTRGSDGSNGQTVEASVERTKRCN